MVGDIVTIGNLVDVEHDQVIEIYVEMTFNLDKIYKLEKIQQVFKTFLDLKKDLQNFLEDGFYNFWLYDYSASFRYNSLVNRVRKHKHMYLKNYIDHSYYNICYFDP